MSDTLTLTFDAPPLSRAWNPVTTLGDDTNAEYFYDYAGDDPINNIDPSGMCWTGLCWASHALDWSAKHIDEIDLVGAGVFCLEGAELGAEVGAETPLTLVGGAVAGCLVNGLTETIIVHRAKERIQQSG